MFEAHLVERSIALLTQQKGRVSFGYNSNGVLTLSAPIDPKRQYLINFRGQQIKNLQNFIDKIMILEKKREDDIKNQKGNYHDNTKTR